MRYSLRFLGALALALGALGACGDNDADSDPSSSSAGTSGSGGNTVSTQTCVDECSAAAQACGATADQAAQVCGAEICVGTITAENLTCLRGIECNQLQEPAQIRAMCGIGGTSTTSTSTSGGGANGNNGQQGDSCMCDPDPNGSADNTAACEGTTTGCEYDGTPPVLSCLHNEQSGMGTCEYLCSVDDVGQQGSCPSGLTCAQGPESVPGGGTYWYTCN